MQIKSTKDIATNGSYKFLVYGQAGAGKTVLASTMPTPIILSAEAGLASISSLNLPYIEISTPKELKDIFIWLRDSKESRSYESVCIDSISEIAEVILVSEKANNKDPRQGYMQMQEQMQALVRAYRDLPFNIYMSAKLDKATDEMGRMLYSPSMPGQKLGNIIPYFFDEVLALRVEKNDEGIPTRTLQCSTDGLWLAKDRCGKLGMWQQPDMCQIIRVMRGE